ncbi:MAG: HDOD domain-containing protein, partial [Phycisphaerales bacterium]|nr:HDOD domain-containing protein [Phycisphaerales bacterium]
MNRAPETNPCVGAPTPDVVLPHFDAAPQLPDAARIAMRGDDVHDRELLNALRGTPRIAATAMSLVNNADASDESDDRSIYLDLTLREAIVLAGVEDWLRQIAYDHPAAEELCEQFTHMVATALSARALAANERRLRIEPADAFIAGLLHDVGKAAIAAVFPRAFQRIAAHAHEMRGDISDAERAMLGVDHAVVGRYVAERWGLPRKIRDVMWLHHLGGDALPSSIQQPQLVRLIRLADVLVREAHVGDSGNYRVYDTSRDLAARLHVDARRVENAQVALEGATLELLAKMGFSRRDAAGSALRPDREADSAVVIRQPNEQQTTFEAISAFNRACGECPDLRAAIRALAVSAAQALASDCVVAITFSEGAPFVPAVASRSGHVNVEFPARPLQHVGGSFDE